MTVFDPVQVLARIRVVSGEKQCQQYPDLCHRYWVAPRTGLPSLWPRGTAFPFLLGQNFSVVFAHCTLYLCFKAKLELRTFLSAKFRGKICKLVGLTFKDIYFHIQVFFLGDFCPVFSIPQTIQINFIMRQKGQYVFFLQRFAMPFEVLKKISNNLQTILLYHINFVL